MPDPIGQALRTESGWPANPFLEFAMSRFLSFAPATIVLAGLLATAPAAFAADCPAFLNHDFKKLRSSQSINLCKEFAGRPLLVVNTASHCGFTPQFKGLEALQEKYQARGLVVVGFPSDDFKQEAKDEAETADVCYVNYGVTFTMLSPTPVTGRAANPVFQELNRRSGQPSWNFNQYLVSADGKVVERFDSGVRPDSAELQKAIERLLPGPVG
jgi:glutathione peroxidase